MVNVSDWPLAPRPTPVWRRGERRFLVFHAQQAAMMHPMHAAVHVATAWQASCQAGFADKTAAYVLVALVLAPTLEKVFTYTNHGAVTDLESWTDDPHVLHLRNVPERSTSVGDIIMEPATGLVVVCASMGWSRINPDGSLGGQLTREEM